MKLFAYFYYRHFYQFRWLHMLTKRLSRLKSKKWIARVARS